MRCYKDHVVRVSDWQWYSKNYPDKCGDDLPLSEDEAFRDRKLSRKDTVNVNEPPEEEMPIRGFVDAKKCLPVESNDANSKSKAKYSPLKEVKKFEEWKQSNRYSQEIPTDIKKKKAVSNIDATARVRASTQNKGLCLNAFTVGELEIWI